MSFERFEPTRTAELNNPETIQSVDGTQVGWKNEGIDTTDKKSDDKQSEKTIPSVEETALKQEKWGAKLNQFAQENPDVLSKKEQWPEAVKQAWLEVKERWPL
jgi:hypothetical protein